MFNYPTPPNKRKFTQNLMNDLTVCVFSCLEHSSNLCRIFTTWLGCFTPNLIATLRFRISSGRTSSKQRKCMLITKHGKKHHFLKAGCTESWKRPNLKPNLGKFDYIAVSYKEWCHSPNSIIPSSSSSLCIWNLSLPGMPIYQVRINPWFQFFGGTGRWGIIVFLQKKNDKGNREPPWT